MKKSSAATDLARTLQLRQAYVDAESDEELEAAKKALLADLRKRYPGIDCNAPQDKIRPHFILFKQLMQEWNPVGYTIEDLKAIAGRPRSETEDSVIYAFDFGVICRHWTFTGRPTITQIHYLPGQ